LSAVVVSQSAPLLVPASPVPVAPEVRCVLRYNDEMTDSDIDRCATARTGVHLACLIGLNRVHEVFIEPTEHLPLIMRVVVSRTSHGGEGRPDIRKPLYSTRFPLWTGH